MELVRGRMGEREREREREKERKQLSSPSSGRLSYIKHKQQLSIEAVRQCSASQWRPMEGHRRPPSPAGLAWPELPFLPVCMLRRQASAIGRPGRVPPESACLVRLCPSSPLVAHAPVSYINIKANKASREVCSYSLTHAVRLCEAAGPTSDCSLPLCHHLFSVHHDSNSVLVQPQPHCLSLFETVCLHGSTATEESAPPSSM